jgi:hypothetical protein
MSDLLTFALVAGIGCAVLAAIGAMIDHFEHR